MALLVMLALPAMAGSPQEEAALNLTRDQKAAVQRGLKFMGHWEAVGTTDGVFGPRTMAAIAAWQKARGDLVLYPTLNRPG